MSKVSIIAAIGKNRALGVKNGLLWHIPDDLKRFRQLTLGHPVIMGRKTFESIVGMLGKPLPGRTNIVVTRDAGWAHEGALVANSLEAALAKAKELDAEMFVIGGAQIYEQALPLVDRLHLTLIDDEKPADVYFPAYENTFTKKIKEEAREYNGLKYTWVDLEKA